MNNNSSPSPLKTTWKADTTHPEKAAILRTAFAEVMDPEIALHIVQLGLVREVIIREDSATISMILTTPYCPYGPLLLEQARKKAEQVLAIPVVMEYGSEAWNPSMMEEEAGADWGLLP
jgi:metal-sulfur cluster biosynthetic enzyme